MFKEYQSKPIVRLAHQINVDDKISFSPKESTLLISNKEYPLGIEFKHYENVLIGDWVVHLNDDAVYHCTDKVFQERNIVE